MTETTPNRDHDIIIVGAGPAGLAAGLYAARARRTTLIFERKVTGGQIALTNDVENYPGFDTINGFDLADAMHKQAEKYGMRTAYADVTAIDQDGDMHIVRTAEGDYRARAVIVTGGADYNKLGVPGEERLTGSGVSYCATCDGAFFRDKIVVVAGGGDSAMEEATFLARFARRVVIVHRRDEFRASPIMVDRARANEKIDFILNAVVEEVLGEADGHVTGLRLRDTVTGEPREIEADGLFVAIGHDPTTGLFLDWLDHDDQGYLVTEPRSTHTNIAGVFAAGDVQDHTYRQAVTAAGSGTMAALDAQRWLEEQRHQPEVAAASV
jgi:thioredoxin reductase (NADPH)